jgi:hypothetical protein
MITAWDIYWITRLDTLNVAFHVMLAISVVACMLLPILYLAFIDFELRSLANVITKFSIPIVIALIVIGGFGWTFTPTTKEACAIYLIPKIANNEQVQKIPNNFAKLLNTKMEEWINNSIADKAENKK